MACALICRATALRLVRSSGGSGRTSSAPVRPLPTLAIAIASQNSHIRPDAHRAKTNIQIREHNGKKAHPGPEHVPAVEATHATIRILAEGSFGRLVQKPTQQMAQ